MPVRRTIPGRAGPAPARATVDGHGRFGDLETVRRATGAGWLLVATLTAGCGATPSDEPTGATAEAVYSEPVAGCDEASIRAGAPASAQPLLDRAYAWVDAGIMYCQCVEAGTSGYRADCSGFVSYVWSQATPGNTTYAFPGGPWDNGHATAIGWQDLTIGDALNFGGDVNAGTGHVMLFGGWTDSSHSQLCAIEESSTGTPAHISKHKLSDPGSWWGGSGTFQSIFQPIRKAGYVPTPPDSPPKGYLDGVDCSQIHGWAQDPDAPTQSISVHVYLDGPAGAAGAIGVPLTADVDRADLCSALGSCNHGFTLTPPRGLLDNQPHEVHAYGIDTAGGANAELSQSPISLDCPPPPAPSGVKRWVTGPAIFSAWKFSYTYDVAHYDDSVVTAYPDGPAWPDAPDLVQADDGTPEVWLIDGSVRRHVVDPASMSAWRLDTGAVTQMPAAQVYAYAQGVDFRAAPFLVMGSGPSVYVLDDPIGWGGAGGSAGASGNSGAAGATGNAGASWTGAGGGAGSAGTTDEDGGTRQAARTVGDAAGCAVAGHSPAKRDARWLFALLGALALARLRHARGEEFRARQSR